MDKIRDYLGSDKGRVFKDSLILCLLGTVGLTLLVGAIHQVGTVLLTKVPMFGFVWGISNRMLPFGLFILIAVLFLSRACKIWQQKEFTRDILLGAGVFSLLGLVLSWGGF